MNLIETTPTTYRLDIGAYPRVTSVLSLVRPDLATIPADVLAHAAQRGIAVHKACWIVSGGDPSGLHWPSVHPEVRPYIEAFQAFCRETRVRFLEQERLVVSRRYGYAGRLDLLAEYKGVQGILDLKTTAEAHASHRLQCSAYLEAWKEQTGSRKRLHRWILYLRANGTYRLVDPDATHNWHEYDFKIFVSILHAYTWMQVYGGNGQ